MPVYTVPTRAGVAPKLNGVVLWGGASTGSNVGTSLGASTVGRTADGYGSILPLLTTINSMTVRAKAGNSFNTMTAGRYIIRRYTSHIGGLANTILNGTGSDINRKSSNYYGATIRTRRIITRGGWNYQTGRPVNAQDSVDTMTVETFPTRAIPGRLTFMVTGKTASVGTYSAKNV